MRVLLSNILRWLRSLRRKPAPAPAPAPRMCRWCGDPLPENAHPSQAYCKPGHARARRRSQVHARDAAAAAARAAGEVEREVERAWGRNLPKKAHAASCARKRSYETFGDALTALRWLREELKPTGQESAYRCLVCSRWHLTSKADAPRGQADPDMAEEG
jgi:hypothetical protein